MNVNRAHPQHPVVPDPAAGDWHLDKRIPVVFLVGLFIALLGQTVVVVQWTNNIENKVTGLTADSVRHESRLSSVEANQGAQAVSSAVTSEQLTALRESMAEIKSSQAETNRLLRSLTTINGNREGDLHG